MSSLTLDLCDDHIKTKLKREMRQTRKTPIRKVKIECLSSEFWVAAGTTLSDREIQSIFAYIGHAFPELHAIEMRVFELPLPVAALDVLLKLTKDTLQVIEMEDVILKGSQEELEGLASTFQGHPGLKKVHFDWCQVRGTSLDLVFQELSTIQTLTQVKICGSLLSVASLKVLCSNQSLKRLSLLDDSLPDDGMAAISEALESPQQHIRELSVRLCGLDPDTGVRFANVLRDNHTLTKLEIRIKDCDWNTYGSAFTDALKANDTLTDVTVYIDGSDTHVDSAADHLITRALAQHASLKSVRIALRGVVQDADNDTILPTAFAERIGSMLQTNTCLEHLQIDGMPMPHEAKFLLRANRAGRHQLLQNPTCHALWTKAIISQRHDVAFTHFLLSQNPTLCPKTIEAPSSPRVFFDV